MLLELEEGNVYNRVILIKFKTFIIYSATGFTTRSDIGPARDANDVSYVYIHYFTCLL